MVTDGTANGSLVTAHRILSRHGHDHFTLGHASARDESRDGFWIKRADLAMGEVGAQDLLHIPLVGPIRSSNGPTHSELPLHSVIYRRRDDVGAIVHTHALEVRALSASTARLEIAGQDSLYFADGIGYHRSAALVTTEERGQRLASDLGSHRAVILDHHGLVTVGESIAEAVVLAVCFVESVRVQLAASQLGSITAMDLRDVQDMTQSMASTHQRRITTMWNLLARQAESDAPRS
jgi:L-fuculose-phosphate aldolase